MLAGELKVAAYADLGGLGARQGPQVPFVWRLLNLLPVLLPWLVVLALLALPSNRNARAWWIWLPLVILVLPAAGLETDDEGLSLSVQAAGAAGFGLAAIWLLGASLARRGRTVSIILMTLAFAAVSLLALAVSPLTELLEGLIEWQSVALFYLILFWMVGGIVFAGALNLTGWRCRQRFSRLRVSLWLPFWLWVMWFVAGGLVVCVATMIFREHFDWNGLLIGPAVLALASFATTLPFLILSFTNAFYRERIKALLRLPAESASPPTPATAPVAGQVSTQ